MPLNEQDIETHAVSDDGPVIAPVVCRAALQRSVAKIFYHAGYEEFQPSALDAVTDIAGDFFEKLTHGLCSYLEEPRHFDKQASMAAGHRVWKNKFTKEESILHALHSSGIDMEGLEGYVRDDIERLGSKLGVMHERMKAHLAELLVSQVAPCFQILADSISVPLSTPMLARMVSAHSTMAANNSSAETLPKKWTRTSSASKSLAWTKSLASRLSVSLFIYFRIACTTRISRRTLGLSNNRSRSFG